MTKSSESVLSKFNPFGGDSGIAAQASDATLSPEERIDISRRLGANIFGAGLLLVGIVIEKAAPEQFQIGVLIQAAAALLVSIAVFREALIGFFAKPPHSFTEQLVALAVLACLAAGDFVSATLVPLLLEIGHLFEERSALGAQAAIKRLKELCTRNATVIIAGNEKTISSDQIEAGMELIVRPGEVIAADGRVTSGFASIDQSPVTGESKPKSVQPGENLYAGTVNLDGLLHMTVEKSGGGTVLGEVIRVLQEVEQTKTPVIRLLDKAASFYLPVVIAIAAIVLFFSGDISRFVTVLIVACPCALVLAAPAAMVPAMSMATRNSVLIKNAAFLEAVASVDTLILDKTGTLTEGSQSVGDVRSLTKLSADDVLALAAAAAHGSRHPASRAITAVAQNRQLSIPKVTECHEVPGRGVEAEVDGQTIRIGRASWLTECGIRFSFDHDSTGVWIAQNNRVIGFVSLLDRARIEALDVVSDMRSMGFSRILLLTGDKSDVAERIASNLGLDEVYAEVLPAEKLDVVRREQHAGRRVLMVGDGINDALALSAADVGIAVGAEMNDVALGGADVALLSNDLRRLPFTVKLADRARAVILENVVIGLVFSVGFLGLASFGYINPLAGALLHNAGAIFVVLNSSKLLEKQRVDTRASGDVADGLLSHPDPKPEYSTFENPNKPTLKVRDEVS